jgi:hypothetical protein
MDQSRVESNVQIHGEGEFRKTWKVNTSPTFANISAREIEFLKYACTEMTYKEIADK